MADIFVSEVIKTRKDHFPIMINRSYFPKRQKLAGFSLVEVLVVLLLLTLLGSIAVATYTDEKSRGYLATSVSDANRLGTEVVTILSDYTSLGNQAGTITLSALPAGVVVFSPMANTKGLGNVLPTGPNTTTNAINLSPGSTVGSSNWDTSGTVNWCIEILNQGTYAKFTNNGEGVEGKGTPIGAQLCVNGA